MADQPDPESSSGTAHPGRKQLILMLAIMVGTLGGSYLLFELAKNTGVWATVNKGEFVQPLTAITDYDWRTIESAPFAREFPSAFAPETGAQPLGNSGSADQSGNQIEGRQSVKRTWWLLAVANDGCDAGCTEALGKLRSLQVLLTKDATRVRRALVLPGAEDAGLAAQYPRLVQLSKGAGPAPASGLYIVDPTGVLVLRYPFADSAADMQKDLKRLLKYSQLG